MKSTLLAWYLLCSGIVSASLKFSTFKEAFTYSGEKMVYIGIGTATTTDTEQYFPQFMKQLYKKYPGQCRLINIDSAWSNIDMKVIFSLFEGMTDSVTLVDERFKQKECDLLKAYIKTVIAKGGVCFICNQAGPLWAPHLMQSYNELYTELKDRLLLYSRTRHGLLIWYNQPYSYYDDIIGTARLQYYVYSNKKNLEKTVTEDLLDTVKVFKSVQGGSHPFLKECPLEGSQLWDDFLCKRLGCTMASLSKFKEYPFTVNFKQTIFSMKAPSPLLSVDKEFTSAMENLLPDTGNFCPVV